MCWSFSILSDNTRCLVWWVNSRNTEAKKARPKIMCFFKNGWKPSQKTRLDALIIFHIEWQHQVSSLVGKQSKYWSEKGKTEKHVFFKNGWKPSQKTRLDALIIFHIEWRHQVSSLESKSYKIDAKKEATIHTFSEKNTPWAQLGRLIVPFSLILGGYWGFEKSSIFRCPFGASTNL